MKKIAVIAITYNGQEDIGEFLRGYMRHASSDATLIVVDNASSDATLDIVERTCPDAVLIKNTENGGYAGGARQGMEYAIAQGAEYIGVVNQDLRFTSRWLEPLVEYLDAHTRCAGVQPRILLYPDTEKINSYGNTIHYLGFGYTLGYQKHVQEYPCEDGRVLATCSGAAVLYRASALDAVGLIDERFFMYHEDSDLSWRLRLAGYDLALSCASTVYHRYEFSRSIKKFYYMERNRILMILKNYSPRALFLIAPMFLVMEAGMVGYSIAGTLFGTRDALTLKEKLRGYLYFFSPRALAYIIRERRKIQKMRTVGDDVIIKLFCDTIEFQDIDNPVLRYIVNPIMRQYWSFIKRIV
jgi:GT2 family glycosyltransferase